MKNVMSKRMFIRWFSDTVCLKRPVFKLNTLSSRKLTEGVKRRKNVEGVTELSTSGVPIFCPRYLWLDSHSQSFRLCLLSLSLFLFLSLSLSLLSVKLCFLSLSFILFFSFSTLLLLLSLPTLF